MNILVCDCGKKCAGDLIQVGTKMYLQGECSEKAQSFLEKRDALHDQVAKIWKEGLAELKAEYDIELP